MEPALGSMGQTFPSVTSGRVRAVPRLQGGVAGRRDSRSQGSGGTVRTGCVRETATMPGRLEVSGESDQCLLGVAAGDPTMSPEFAPSEKQIGGF